MVRWWGWGCRGSRRDGRRRWGSGGGRTDGRSRPEDNKRPRARQITRKIESPYKSLDGIVLHVKSQLLKLYNNCVSIVSRRKL